MLKNDLEINKIDELVIQFGMINAILLFEDYNRSKCALIILLTLVKIPLSSMAATLFNKRFLSMLLNFDTHFEFIAGNTVQKQISKIAGNFV